VLKGDLSVVTVGDVRAWESNMGGGVWGPMRIMGVHGFLGRRIRNYMPKKCFSGIEKRGGWEQNFGKEKCFGGGG